MTTDASSPLVSVIISAYNGESYIAECIQSVLAQTWPYREIIVVDDGSTDSTAEIAASFGPQVRLLRKPNGGPASAFNAGIPLARGELLARLDCDDAFLPGKLARQVAYLQRDPDVGLVFTGYHMVDAQGRLLRTEVIRPEVVAALSPLQFLKANHVNGSTVLFRRSCLEGVGFFDESLICHQDTDMWIRLIRQFRFGCLPEPLIRCRSHPLSLSHNRPLMLSQMRRLFRKVFRDPGKAELFGLPPRGFIARRRQLAQGQVELARALRPGDFAPLAPGQFLAAFLAWPFSLALYHALAEPYLPHRGYLLRVKALVARLKGVARFGK